MWWKLVRPYISITVGVLALMCVIFGSIWRVGLLLTGGSYRVGGVSVIEM